MYVTFTKDQIDFTPLRLSREDLQPTECVKILGVKITKNRKWDVHVSDIIKRARIFILTTCTLRRFGMSLEDLRTIYRLHQPSSGIRSSGLAPRINGRIT